jgi:hypothetical protein
MKARKIVAALLALILSASVLAGCSVKESGPEQVTGVPATEVTVITTAPAERPTEAPTSAPTEAPTEVPEPTEKPDYSGGITEGKRCTYNFWGGGATDAYCGTGHRLAVQFYATTDFTGVGFHSPTWTAKDGYSVDYELYVWDSDYETTVDNEPVATAIFENWQDGICVPITFEEPMPSGEYVLLAMYHSSETMHNGGVWFFPDQEREDIISYLDDDVWYDHVIRTTIYYANTPNVKYGPLSDPGI